jgi:hypothetical protein
MRGWNPIQMSKIRRWLYNATSAIPFNNKFEGQRYIRL